MNNNYIESLIFFYILGNNPILSQYKENYFTNPLIRAVFDIVKNYVNEYHEQPTAEQTWELVKVSTDAENSSITYEQIAALWEAKKDIHSYGEEWLQSNAKSYGEWKNLEDAIVKTIEYVKTKQVDVTIENAAEVVSNAKMIFQSKSNFNVSDTKVHNFFDPETHKLDALETRTTGYPFVDKCLNGGWSNKSLIVFMGGPKVGKSMWLCNLCANAVRLGQDSAYITCEMAYQKVAHRIGANLLNVPIDEYKAMSDDANKMNEKFAEFRKKHPFNKPGEFDILEYPTSSATVAQLEADLLKAEERHSAALGRPFKFKNIFLDYLNIMADQKHPHTDSTYITIKSICEDVRAMAQRNNWCVISLTQVNRDGQETSDLSMTNVSESTGLTMTVDALIGIIRDMFMMANNTYYLKGVALRDSKQMGNKKKYLWDVDYLRITEDTSEDIIEAGVVQMAAPAPAQSSQKKKTKTLNAAPQPIPSAPQPTQQAPTPIPQTFPMAGAPVMGISDAQVSLGAQQLFQ